MNHIQELRRYGRQVAKDRQSWCKDSEKECLRYQKIRGTRLVKSTISQAHTLDRLRIVKSKLEREV